MIIALCLILTLTLLPIGALAAEPFDVTITVGEHGKIIIGDPPEGEEEDTRVTFTMETSKPAITIEANNDGPESTPVPIRGEPDDGYEIDSVTLGDTVLAVGQSISIGEGLSPPWNNMISEGGYPAAF